MPEGMEQHVNALQYQTNRVMGGTDDLLEHAPFGRKFAVLPSSTRIRVSNIHCLHSQSDATICIRALSFYHHLKTMKNASKTLGGS